MYRSGLIKPCQNTVKEFGFAFGIALLALLTRFLLDPALGDHLPYVTFFPAVAATAWYTGLSASLTTVVLGGLASTWFFMPPRQSLMVVGVAQQVGFATYFLVSLTFVWFGHALRRSQQRTEAVMEGLRVGLAERKQAEEAVRQSEARLQVFSNQLEQLVHERTDELVQSQHRLRVLATELNLAEQRERKRLADELHDYLAQLLVLCRLNLGQVRRAGLPSKTGELVRETEEVLNQALTYSRTLMAELSPPVLRQHGLPAGLRWLGEQMQHRGLIVTVNDTAPADLSLPEHCAVILFQSVRELLMNTLKHAKSHAVTVCLDQYDGRLRIAVRDDGIGFNPTGADASLSTALSSKFGLFSIRERMTALGGWLDVQSAPGEGTTATLVLPLKGLSSPLKPSAISLPVEEGARETINAHPSAPSPVAQRSVYQPNAVVRVLLVDDHAMVREGLRSVLESYPDVDVVGQAVDGEEAVALVARLQPSLVVMDINMPKMNGIEATAAIKTRYPDIVVIGLSVQAGGANAEAMRKAGAVMLLTKEGAVDELYRAIREALDMKRITPKNS